MGSTAFCGMLGTLRVAEPALDAKLSPMLCSLAELAREYDPDAGSADSGVARPAVQPSSTAGARVCCDMGKIVRA